MAHVINLAVQCFLKTLKVAAPTEEERFEMGKEDSDSEEDENVPGPRNATPKGKDFPSKSNGIFASTIEKLRSISKAINFPPTRTEDFFKLCDAAGIKCLKAVIDHQIRWNSTFSMILRAVYLKDSIKLFTNARKELRKYILTDQDWELAEFLVRFLSPFKFATDLLQCNDRPSLHETWATYTDLFNNLEDVLAVFQQMDPKPGWLGDVEVAISNMWKKLKKHYTRTSHSFAYADATILHPGKKLSPFRRSGFKPGDAAKYEREFRERFSSYNTQSEPSPPSLSPQHLK